MNGRVLLLVMVTGLFMAAWDSDQAAMQAALAKREAARQSLIAHARQPNQQEPHRLTGLPSTSDPEPTPETIRRSSDEAVAAVRRQDVPLPAAIAAGSYQVVDQFGHILRIDIDRQRARGNVAQDFYVTDGTDGRRWYFVRLRR